MIRKLTQRKGLVALTVLGAFLLLGGFDLIWSVANHHGSGYQTIGGDAPDYSGQPPTQEVVVKVSEQQYKRNSYLSGAILIFMGGMLSWGVIIKWKEP